MSEVGEGMKRPAEGAGADADEGRECRTEDKTVVEECREPAAKMPRSEEAEKKKKKEEDEGTGDSFEREVGITEYTGPQVPGFRGILKDRYSDFLVNEVDMAGNVVHLTGIAMPEDAPTSPFSTAERRAAAAAAAGAGAAQTTDAQKSVQEELAAIVGAEEAARFVAWHEAQEQQEQQQEKEEKETKQDDNDGDNNSSSSSTNETEGTEKKEQRPNPEAVFRFAALKDKAGRGAVHALVKARLAGFCSGAEDGVVWVRRGQGDVRHSGWPRDRPRFLAFTLYKENMDTAYALEVLARRVGARPNNFSVAGNKDKRGVTCQRVTACRVDARRLLTAVQGRVAGMLVGDFCYVDHALGLGELRGNRFTLAVRDIDAPLPAVAAAVANLQANGFVNYFGLQRFGTGSVRTHEVGIAILQDDWARAAQLVMAPQGRGNPSSNGGSSTGSGSTGTAEANRARELFAAGNLAACAALLPRKMHIEHDLVRGLLRCGPTAYRCAFDYIPRTTRKLYLHAYQSYVWNTVASARIRAHGLAVLPGDLVLADPAAAAATTGTDAATSMPVAISKEGRDSKDDDVDTVRTLPAVRTVTAEEVAAGTFSARDVLLPLPGTDVRQPENDTRALFDAAVARTGVTAAQIARGRGVYALRGDYRPLVCVPQDVAWHVAHYSDPTEPLLRTDADAVRGVAPRVDPGPDGAHTRRALCISFTLQPSAYATMCYRELLKQATSQEYQTRLQHERAPAPEAREAYEAAPAAAVVVPSADSTTDAAPTTAPNSNSNSESA